MADLGWKKTFAAVGRKFGWILYGILKLKKTSFEQQKTALQN